METMAPSSRWWGGTEECVGLDGDDGNEGRPIVESVELKKISAQYADLLAETVSGRLCHIELQAANDPHMAIWMLEYASRVYRIFG